MELNFQQGLEFAKQIDGQDKLRSFRSKFCFPKNKLGEDYFYFCGNSLGLAPKKARQYVENELEAWEKHAVEGHFTGKFPWMPYHEFVTANLAHVVGAKDCEVVAMNSLTVNLHLLLVSFFRPQGKKTKILCEKDAFPSDQYALKSQLKFHGLDPKEHLVEVSHHEILDVLEEKKDELCLLCLGGVHYLTGAALDISVLMNKAKQFGITVGLDLAHAAGNILLNLHEDEVDFAVWCSYKYLNSGPGGIAGAFVHEKHHGQNLPRFAGWWGQNKKTRFLMGPDFDPIPSVEAWQLSKPPIFQLASLRASLEIFAEATISSLRQKSMILTSYLEWLLKKSEKKIEILTPSDTRLRGAQLSVKLADQGVDFVQRLAQKNVMADFRQPNILRMAPTPLYNSFVDVFHLAKTLEELL